MGFEELTNGQQASAMKDNKKVLCKKLLTFWKKDFRTFKTAKIWTSQPKQSSKQINKERELTQSKAKN